MFLTLLKKECLQHLKSITYYIFLACLVLDFLTQMGEFETINKPEPGQEDYGWVKTENKEVMMETALQGLLAEYERGVYITYPIGFYKQVHLDETEQKGIEEGLSAITGMRMDEIEEALVQRDEEWERIIEEKENNNEAIMGNEEPDVAVTVKEGLSWQEFLAEMKKIDELLGGGSNYNEGNIQRAEEPATYEQALAEYDSFIKEDKVTNAYARLFCDYQGIMLAILPVFLAVTRGLRDKKAQAEQVIYMHRATSFAVVASRYFAAVIVVVVPVILLSCSTLIQAVYYAGSIQAEYDALAFVKHIGFWLLPIILVSLSVGFFFTELTDSAIAILIQGAWWFISIFISGYDLVGSVGWNLVPRFNTVGSRDVYEQICGQLMRNRLIYTAAALVLLLLTIWIYSKKRKGEFVSVGTVLKNRKNKLEA
ncbi:MAG: hypothetical protein NC300_12375 [Bacteroidales bacterium]|nr:ABC transporter permease [Clostridium sp.]MCM1204929.1 hypothetical protein [Bacteroidales bacterium]